MRISNFPWSPVLAGWGAGITGFAVAAVATGFVHLGPTLPSPGADRIDPVTGRVVADPQQRAAVHHCPCCCDDCQSNKLTAVPDAEPWLLTAISPPHLIDPTSWSCEDDDFNWPATSPTLADPRTVAAQDPWSDLILDPTSFVSGDLAAEPTSAAMGSAQPRAATAPLAALDGLAGSRGFYGGLGIPGAGFGGAAGASSPGSSTRPAAPTSADARSTALAELVPTQAPPSLTQSLSFRFTASTPLDTLRTADGAMVATADGPSGLIAHGSPAAPTPGPIDPAPTNPASPAAPIVTAAAIPEPASVVLSTIGLAVVGMVSWSRRWLAG